MGYSQDASMAQQQGGVSTEHNISEAGVQHETLKESKRTSRRGSVAQESYHIGFVSAVFIGLVLIAAISMLTGIDYSGDSVLFSDRCPNAKAA